MNISTQMISAACYCRLSQEDAKLGESVSIDTQKKILEDFCKRNDFRIYDYYVDDGYTGTNFDRPDFKRMINDIRAGMVNYVLVKDLSRFGREHLKVGEYIERIFPEMGVRFLALGDDVDTSNVGRKQTDHIMTSVKNIFNELWPAETSDKVRTAFHAKVSRGEFIGAQAPYGYIKSPQDKHVLIPDPETAPTVQWIFEMAANSGYGYNKIAKVLTARRFITPAALQAQRAGREYKKDPYDWNLVTVGKMLFNDVYLGTVTSFKRVKQSYKSDKEVRQDASEWVVNPNMHEPIISKELWDAAHEKLATHKRVCPSGYVNIFSGLLRCDSCGATLGMGNCAGKDVYYVCNTYKKKGADRCTNHYIRFDSLYSYVLSDLRAFIENYQKDKNAFRTGLCERFGKNDCYENYDNEIAELQNRKSRATEKLKMIYDDRLDGLITREQFKEQSLILNAEQQTCDTRLKEIEKILSEDKDKTGVIASFIDLLDEHETIDELDSELLNRFIDKIVVGNRMMDENGNFRQDITIHYRFIG